LSGWSITIRLAFAGAAALALAGCAYDYLQHTDRVGYSAGDAVKANLAQETTNPSRRSMYVTSGLGKNGVIGGPPPGAPNPE
jgi:hypothetical protein